MRTIAARYLFLTGVFAALLVAFPAAGITANPVGGSDWAASAKTFRGQDGTQVDFTCPSNGARASVWGSVLYTDDSSVCSAAVHSGLITFAGGGQVTIEIRPGASSYAGTSSHGVTTSDYGAWSGSYVIVSAHGGAFAGSNWTSDVKPMRGQNGATFRWNCPANPGGGLHAIWGTSVYTDDSPVCIAAVHAGIVTLAHGGTATIRVQAGRAKYTGSTRHGIKSLSYGSWAGSYVFTGK